MKMNEIKEYTASELIFSEHAFARMHQLASIMAGGKTTVPEHLAGNPADCMAIVMQAAQWRMNPFAVAQKTHLVSGKLGYEAQLVNAVITSMAPIDGRLDFEFFGAWERVIGKFRIETSQGGKQYAKPAWTPDDEKGLGIVVRGTLKGEKKPRELTLLMSQCWPRQSTNWAYDPQQQMVYSGIKKWSRRYVPDVILGVYTPDELGATEIDVTDSVTVVSREREIPQPAADMTPRSKPRKATQAKPPESEPDAQPQEPAVQQTVASEPSEAPEEPKLTPGQLTILLKKLGVSGMDEGLLLREFGVEELADIPARRINEALKMASTNAAV